jgi:hypothetical protein
MTAHALDTRRHAAAFTPGGNGLINFFQDLLKAWRWLEPRSGCIYWMEPEFIWLKGAPVKTWGVELVGHHFDLEDWSDTLKRPFDPWVERHNDRYFLRTAQFDGAADFSEVRDRAVPIVEQINAAMEIILRSQSVRLESGVAEFDAEGRLKVHVIIAVGTAVARTRVHAPTVTLTKNGRPIPLPPPIESKVQRWATLSEAHDLLADALVYFNRAEWFDIYKAIECLEDWVGGEDALRAKEWIKAADLKRLKRTANSFRHRKGGKHTPPNDPLTLVDARHTLGKLITGAFNFASE